METAGDCRKTRARVNPNPLTHLQEVEPRVAKRRLAQARHRATLARLFSGLREAVLSQSDNSALKHSGNKPRDPMMKQNSECRNRRSCRGGNNSFSLMKCTLSSRHSGKYQVLRKAKKSIQKLEQTLGSFLKMKEPFSLEDGNPSSLEEVREEYVKRHFSNHSTASALEAVSESDSTVWHLIGECEKQTLEEDGKPELIQSSETSSPDLVEFERYLYFYKHTVDLLIEHRIVCTEEVPLPEVSTAISHLWQELSEERRDSILQYCSQRDFLMDPKAACQEPACTEGSVRDSRGNSEEASGSSVSTPEEIMFEDAFDVAAGFLDRSETQGMSSQRSDELSETEHVRYKAGTAFDFLQWTKERKGLLSSRGKSHYDSSFMRSCYLVFISSAFASCTSESPENHQGLYLQITDFLKSLFFANTQFCQEEDLQTDYETVMLRCTETFDDEDF